MKRLINLFRQFAADAIHSGDIFYPCPGKPLQTTELFQQILAALLPDAGNVFQDRAGARLVATLAVACDGKPVRLIANMLYQMQRR